MASWLARAALESNLARRMAATVHVRIPIAASVKNMPTMPPMEYARPSIKMRYATGMLVAAVRKEKVVAASGLSGPMAWNTMPIWMAKERA
jgi:hypothetical protein